MSIRRRQLGLAAFALLVAGVAANMLLLQSNGRGRQSKLVDERAIFARELAEGARLTTEALPPQRPTVAPASADGRAAIARAAKTGDGEPALRETTTAIQRELQALGYETGSLDGTLSLMTRAAIVAFETDHKMPLTAEPSDALLRAIILGPQGGAPQAGRGKDKRPHLESVVSTVQQSLAVIGYQGGKPDGRLSDDLTRAIGEFEMDQGLKVTGRISGTLVARLAKAAAAGRTASRRP